MGGIDKLMQPIGEVPLLARTLAAFDGAIDRTVVVASESNFEAVSRLVESRGIKAQVVVGGARRRDSVMAGIEALPDCEYVVVHDGARPFLTAALIEAVLGAAKATGAAIAAVRVTDTVKREEPLGESTEDAAMASRQLGGLVRSTVSREGLWLAQTPQAFRRELLLRAHAASDVDATDDAALVEWLGEPVRLVPGSARNLKVTTPEDLAMAQALARNGTR
jgi:2-C-methyl-D-erythritol 4-phosphate cytidylyltransferase